MHDQNIKGEKRMVIQEKEAEESLLCFRHTSCYCGNPDSHPGSSGFFIRMRTGFCCYLSSAASLNFANGYDRFHNNRGKKEKEICRRGTDDRGSGTFPALCG